MRKPFLVLITEQFPFGYGEGIFIKKELDMLSKEYEIVIISEAERLEASEYEEFLISRGIRVINVASSRIKKHDIPLLLIRTIISPIFINEISSVINEKRSLVKNIRVVLSYYMHALLFLSEVNKDKSINIRNADLIYTYWMTHKTLGCLLGIEKSKHRPIVVSRVHGKDLFNEREVLAHRLPYRKYINSKIDVILFACKQAKDYYQGTFTYDSDIARKEVAYIGTSDQTSYINQYYRGETFRIVSCSNAIPLKRVELIIYALSVAKLTMEVEWIHFGGGSSLPFLKKLAKQRLDNNCKIKYCFMGFTNNSDIISYYRANQVDCFVTTSSTEGGVPVSIQEALSFGIPIIGTAVGGVSESIDHNGILLPPNPSEEEIANAFIAMMDMPKESYLLMRERSLEIWRERFDSRKNAERFLKRLEAIFEWKTNKPLTGKRIRQC